MNLAQLQQLTDELLIEKVAVEVMGWKSDGTWKKMGYLSGEGQFVAFSTWNPLTDWSHTMEVAQKATNAFGLTILLTQDGSAAVQIIQAPPCHYRKINAEDNSPQRAICFAALLAVS